jgi:tetratricopeptide (TPR) repeat protein
MGGPIATREHPAAEALQAFALGSATAEQARTVVTHLLHGCQECADRVAYMGALSVAPAEPSPYDGGYDFAITRALRSVLSKDEDELRVQLAMSRSAERGERLGSWEAGPRPRGWAQCEALIDVVRELRHDVPATLLRLSQLAAGLAESLDERACGPRNVRDLQARAWGEVGNALRVGGELRRAEEIFGRAFARAAEGSGDPLLFAGLADLAASLCRAQRKFREACELLDLARRIYLEYDDPHLAGRTLISKAMVLDYASRPREAARLLYDGLGLIDGARDPRLLLTALHHYTSLAIDEGDFARAARLLAESRELYDEQAELLDLLRRRRLEGRTAFGLGDDKTAERAFQEAREGFARRELPYEVALASLDLAAIWLRQGRTGRVRRTVEEMLATFRSHGIRREAIATLLVLRRALERERATERLLQAAAARLRRVERWPAPPAAVLPFTRRTRH